MTNAIVLVDLVNQYRDARHDGRATRSCTARRRRLRPILMTALATIFALLPMALGLTGHGGFISQPLAIVVIGGLVSSTLLTLVVLPTLYNLVEGAKERRIARRGAKADAGSLVPTLEPEFALAGVPVGTAVGAGAADSAVALTRRERRALEAGAVAAVTVPMLEEDPDIEVSESAEAPTAVADAVHTPASVEAAEPAAEAEVVESTKVAEPGEVVESPEDAEPEDA